MGAPKLSSASSIAVFLVVKDGPTLLFEKTFDSFPVVIGRSANCDIPVPHLSWVSRQHIRFEVEGGEVSVEDLSSTNGFLINGEKHKKAILRDGSVIEVFSLRVEVSIRSVAGQSAVSEETTAKTQTYTAATVVEPRPQLKVAPPSPPLPQDTERTYVTGNDLIDTSPESAPLQMGGFDMIQTGATVFAKPQPTASHHPAKKRLGYLLTERLNQPIANMETVPRNRRVLEAYVTWKGQVIDTKLCRTGGRLRGGTSFSGLYIPTANRNFDLASYEGNIGTCYIPDRSSGLVTSINGRQSSFQDLVRSQAMVKHRNGFAMKLQPNEVCQIQLGNDVVIYLRYAYAPRQLSKKPMVETDELLQKAGLASGLIHLLFLLMVVFVAPQPHPLKFKNLSPRVAKLLIAKKKVEPPKPPPPPEEKKPEPPKMAEKKPEPKKEIPKVVQPKPKKVVVKTNEHMKKLNRTPEVKVKETPQPVVEKPVQKNIQELGALAALGALGAPTKNPTNQPVAINVNKNAGGASSLSTSGVIGALKSKEGRLAGAGMPGVKTKGHGYGTGTGYGVQGLQGRAGARGVEGAVVGAPSLMKISRNEGLTQKEVMEVVKKYSGRIQQCYERALLSEPGLAGRIEYEWNISPQGDVKSVKVKRTDMQAADHLNDCVTGVFKEMKFPTAKNGESTTPSIGFPFGRL